MTTKSNSTKSAALSPKLVTSTSKGNLEFLRTVSNLSEVIDRCIRSLNDNVTAMVSSPDSLSEFTEGELLELASTPWLSKEHRDLLRSILVIH